MTGKLNNESYNTLKIQAERIIKPIAAIKFSETASVNALGLSFLLTLIANELPEVLPSFDARVSPAATNPISVALPVLRKNILIDKNMQPKRNSDTGTSIGRVILAILG